MYKNSHIKKKVCRHTNIQKVMSINPACLKTAFMEVVTECLSKKNLFLLGPGTQGFWMELIFSTTKSKLLQLIE